MISKPRESAALLLCLGVVFLLPPLGLIFGKGWWLLGIPLPVLYVFGVWLILVGGALVLSRLLPD